MLQAIGGKAIARTSFFQNGYAHAARIRSNRRGDHHGRNHMSSCALCVELSELTSGILIGDVSSRSSRSPRSAE